MNRELLLQHFDRISEAPDSIPRLRRFILDLAVRGKLVEQDSSDEPAAELLKRIQSEKARLVKEGVLRKQDYFPEIGEIEFPYSLPSSWLWCRIGALGKTQTGTTPPKGKSEYFGTFIPFIKPGDIYPDRLDYSNEGLSKIGINESGRLAQTGSILMVCIGTIGKCQRIDRDCSFNQQINSLSPYSETDSNYLLDACQSDFFQKSAWAASACTTIAILNKGKWEHLLLPLPPLAEQHRIVAKVDELMALCDQLQAERNKRESRRDRLVASSLNRISTAPAEEAKDATRFHLNHLPRLTTRTEHIKQLRQTILNLAVRGRLVPQDPNDEPAAELLKRVALKKKTSSGNAPKIGVDGDKLPTGWVAATLAQYSLDISTGPFGTALHQSDYTVGGIPLVNPSHMINDRIVPNDRISVPQNIAERLASYRLKTGDIVMARRGEVGRAALVEAHQNGWLCGTGSFFLRFTPEINRHFFLLLLRSTQIRSYLAGKAVGTTMVNLNHNILKHAQLDIPPIAEQHRIVAKVDELMALCDQLESQLTTTEADSRRLLQSVLRDALNPVIKEAS